MSTQRQNSLSNIGPPQFLSCPQLTASPPNIKKKERGEKDKLVSNEKLISGPGFILSKIPSQFSELLSKLLMFLPNTNVILILPPNCFFFPKRFKKYS